MNFRLLTVSKPMQVNTSHALEIKVIREMSFIKIFVVSKPAALFPTFSKDCSEVTTYIAKTHWTDPFNETYF